MDTDRNAERAQESKIQTETAESLAKMIVVLPAQDQAVIFGAIMMANLMATGKAS